MIAHGSATLTQDVDVCYARDLDNLKALAEALRPVHPRLRGLPDDVPFVWDFRTLRNGSNFTLATGVGNVDTLAEVEGVASFDALWNRAVPMELYGTTVRVASVDDLIAMKRAAGRPKDELHLLELQRMRQLLSGPEDDTDGR
jgi:hypothetical protein